MIPSQVFYSEESPLTPPLKWAGGKRWLIPKLKNYGLLFRSCRLVEPFCGGLAVALGFNPHQAWLNDVNPHLINFYRQIQSGLQIKRPFQNQADFYQYARERFNALIAQGQEQTPEAAQWFYYLNRTGFNGLCRFNKKGFFNVPFGRYKNIGYRYQFDDYTRHFGPWEFTGLDFEAMTIQHNDWIYADPPYDVPFVSYAQGGFTWADQVRLAQWLAKQTVPVVASNQATPRILELYNSLGFEIEIILAPRRISCTGDRTPTQEIIATKHI